MIKRLKDSDKFICNVISKTGKTVRQKIFNSWDEAIKFRENQLKLKSVEDVEIYSEEKNILPFVGEDSEPEPKTATCCICGGELGEYGNNASPICEEGECCDECNDKFVIPARLLQHYKPYKAQLFVKCKNCGLPVILAEDKNVCSCGTEYNATGNRLDDSFAEISKAMKQSNKPLKHKKLKISTETARKIAQSTTLIGDARAYIGEYIDEYYERYRGITIYKLKDKDGKELFAADYFDERYVANNAKDLRERLDEEITKRVDNYKNDFEIKEIKEINKDLTKGD